MSGYKTVNKTLSGLRKLMQRHPEEPISHEVLSEEKTFRLDTVQKSRNSKRIGSSEFPNKHTTLARMA